MAGPPLTAAEAAPILGVKGVNAAREYLNALSDQPGTGVKREAFGKGHQWRFVLPHADAATAVAIAREMLATLRGTTLDQQLVAAQYALTGGKPPADDHARQFYGHGRARRLSAELHAGIVDAVVTALRDGQLLAVRYAHFGGDSEDMSLRVLTFVPHDEGLYCVAKCVGPRGGKHLGTTRVYNLARFDSASVTPHTSPYPARDEYDPEAYFEHSFGIFVPADGMKPVEVKLLFAKDWENYLRRHSYHHTQRGPNPAGDRWRVTYTLAITYDLVRFIRGHGVEITVEAPTALGDWVTSGLGASALRRFFPAT
ncbi:MAG: WYL domain-containing protein [Myxococcales bacterium]|nr:WYL domain-containing protein [Myxococcales bacterium]